MVLLDAQQPGILTLLRFEVRVSIPGLAAPLDSMKADSLSLSKKSGREYQQKG